MYRTDEQLLVLLALLNGCPKIQVKMELGRHSMTISVMQLLALVRVEADSRIPAGGGR